MLSFKIVKLVIVPGIMGTAITFQARYTEIVYCVTKTKTSYQQPETEFNVFIKFV